MKRFTIALLVALASSMRGGGLAVTIDDAKQLKACDHVASPHDLPAYRIRRLTRDPWVSTDGTIVRLSMASYSDGAWVPPDGFILAPGPDAQWRFDVATKAFVSRHAEPCEAT